MENLITVKSNEGEFYIIKKNLEVEEKDFISNSGIEEDLKNLVVESMDLLLSPIKVLADSVVKKTQSFTQKPDEIELEMNISFGLKSGKLISIITEAEGSTDIKVIFKWKNTINNGQ